LYRYPISACRSIAPVFAELAGKYPNAVFTKVDVDELADIASDQGIEAMPTFRIFKAGKQIFEMRGADPAGLSKACAEHCA
jgi:thioredoxin 1